MARLIPVSWQTLVDRLSELGWSGPHKKQGKKRHTYYMAKGAHKLTIPNPHRSDIGVELLKLILKQAGVSRDEWLGE